MQTDKKGHVVNAPQFKIHGNKRRELKKKLSKLKGFVSSYKTEEVYFTPGKVDLSDNKKHQEYHKKLKEMKDLEEKLNEPYKNN